MLAGHWQEGIVVPSTGLPPLNVESYAQEGLIPAFRRCMEEGTFVRAWNRGICTTPYGQRYLCSGSYRVRAMASEDPYWRIVEGIEPPTILDACTKTFPDGKTAAFGSDAWMQTGWWKAATAPWDGEATSRTSSLSSRPSRG